jgi:flavin-dependent dehydrogenase
MPNESNAFFDVIIVGGGPAGAAAAITCRHRGRSVLLIEDGPAKGACSLLPGENLHPAMERIFRSLGVEPQMNRAGFLRHAGHSIQIRGKRQFQPFGFDPSGPWRGYLADRSIMHRILLEEAARCGARVLQHTRAARPVLNNGRIAGVITTDGLYECAFLIDASGHRSWLSHHLDLETFQVSPRLIARFGWLKPAESQHNDEPLPEFRMNQSGWQWRAPIRHDCQAWVCLNLDLDLEGGRKPRHGRRAVGRDGFALGTSGARDVSWRITPSCAGPGYFLIGDAAWVLDPASSHGVFKATMSAIIAAEAIAANTPSRENAYCAWMRDWFCSDAGALIELYSQAASPAPWLETAAERVRYIARIPSFHPFR